jgi:hypothetical protein
LKINGSHNALPPVGSGSDRSGSGPVRARHDRTQDDALEISGRAEPTVDGHLKLVGLTKAGSETGSPLDQVRTKLQERIRNGFYADDEVLGAIAGTMLDLFGL